MGMQGRVEGTQLAAESFEWAATNHDIVGGFQGANIIILDLEVANSPNEVPTGWKDKVALGLSVGAYYDYQDGRVHWFDRMSLESTIWDLVTRAPLMVSFNGIGFDFALMRALLRREAEEIRDAVPAGQISERAAGLIQLCNDFKLLAASSYDILAEIWAADSEGKFEGGLNSLDAILAANDLGQKSGHGAEAPKQWQAGRYADVLNYCQDDVYLIKALFEYISEHGGWLRRRNGALHIRHVCGDSPLQ